MGNRFGELFCDRCGDDIPAYDVETGHSEMYLTWSHPVYGSGSKIFCSDPIRECAEKTLYALGMATHHTGVPILDAPPEVLAMKDREDGIINWPVDLVEYVPPSRKLPVPREMFAVEEEPADAVEEEDTYHEL